jgi:hypothetical protein
MEEIPASFAGDRRHPASGAATDTFANFRPVRMPKELAVFHRSRRVNRKGSTSDDPRVVAAYISATKSKERPR